MKIWKRNAVVMTVVLFVCVALYLSWSYNRESPEDPLDAYVNSETLGTDAGSDAMDDPLRDINISVPLEDAMDANDTANPDGDVNVSDAQDGGYFSEIRLNRQRARDSALEILREAADRKESDQSVRDKATAEIENLAQSAMSEARIEGLVRAKGFADCVATISSENISIVVASPEGGLLATDVAKITDIVISETNLPASAIKISESKV